MMLSIRQYMDQINWIRALNEGIVENLPLGVLVYDGGKNMIFRNPQADAMLNLPEETDEKGDSLEDIVEETMQRDEVLPLPGHPEGPCGKKALPGAGFLAAAGGRKRRSARDPLHHRRPDLPAPYGGEAEPGRKAGLHRKAGRGRGPRGQKPADRHPHRTPGH